MDKLYDAIIIGGGPSGLSAAIYMARAQYRTLVIEKDKTGGQITITSEVVNYPGVISTSGTALTENMRKQAENFGAEFLNAEVTELNFDGHIKKVTANKVEYSTIGIVIATGAVPRTAGFKGENEFKGHGVAYCATCDGEFFTGKDIFVIGGGFAAAEEAVFLTKYAKTVTICVREEDFTCAKMTAEQAVKHPKIKVLYNTEIVEAGGDSLLRYAVLRNNVTGEETRYDAPENDTFGIFVFAGYKPETKLFKDKLELTEYGYLVTDKNQKTNIDGVYGAGDVCDKPLRQVVTAVSDGAVTAVSLEKYASEIHAKYDIPQFEFKRPAAKTSENIKTTGNTGGAIDKQGHDTDGSNEFFSSDIKKQLTELFSKLEHKLILRVHADNSDLSNEAVKFTKEVCGMSDMLDIEVKYPISDMKESDQTSAADEDFSGEKSKALFLKGNTAFPAIELCYESGISTGFAFHGVPGGHELNSFVITIYNAGGKGQDISEKTISKIKSLSEKHLKIAVTLSCTLCPATAMAAARIALINENITTEIYDLSRYPDMREKYGIMSVPCIISDDKAVAFGKKSIDEIIDAI